MSSFEKSVKGATKVKLAAPKSKYVENILIATHTGDAGVAELFRALNHRMKDPAWTIVFKSLIVIHLMIREGEKDVALKFLRKNPRIIAISNYNDVQEQGRNIRCYSLYIHERAKAYGDVRTDYVRSGEGRLRKLSVDKGLLREVECVQTQINALLKCSFLDLDVDNEITLTAFRLLVMDLLVFFHVVNEGVINVLEHYFEMSKVDAERALKIYKTFTKQTADIVEYLQTARRLETSTRLQIPNLKHAPTSLTQSLEEYLNDPDFEINRRQYLAAQEAKKNGGKVATKVEDSKPKPAAQATPKPSASSSAPAQPPPPKVAPDLIDFFDSIEKDQPPMFPDAQQQQLMQAQAQYAQASMGQQAFSPQQPFPGTGADFMNFPQYATGAFPQSQPALAQQPIAQPIRTDFTGHGFGGYTPQDQNTVSIPAIPTIPQQFQVQIPQQQPFQVPLQQGFPNQPVQQPAFQIQQQSTAPLSLNTQETNPFRSMMTGSSPSSYASSPPPAKSTNPFQRAAPTQQAASPVTAYQTGMSPVFPSYSTQPTPPQPQQTPVRSHTTGTNPFARNMALSQSPPVPPIPASISPSAGMLTVQQTGVTNPFRASMMQQQALNGQATGTVAGWENVQTIPVFPRTNNTAQNLSNGGQQPW